MNYKHGAYGVIDTSAAKRFNAKPFIPDSGGIIAQITVDDDGNAVITGAALTVDDNGNGVITGAALTVDENGNAVLG